MKKLNLGNINAGLSTIKELANENAGIARDELIDVSLIDFANKNTYAANDTDDSIRDLADQIETVGLLNPLGVIQSGNRYKLFSGERRYRAITQYLHWDKIPCRIFEGVSAGRAQLMLHIANGGRNYTAEQKLALYEEYRALLDELKASGEFKGGIQKGVAELMHVSDRQVRTYRTMSEQLTEPEKVDLAAGTLKFGEAQNIAVERAAKATQPTVANATKSGSTSAFSSKTESTKSSLSPEMREDLLRKVIMSGYVDTDILEELLSLGGLGIQYCIKSELAYSKLTENKEGLIRVEYSVFNDKYNQRDVRARENMHDLIESDANKVTNVFSTLF